MNLIEIKKVRDLHNQIDDEATKKLKLTRLNNILFKKKNNNLRIYLNVELAKLLIKNTHLKLGHIGSLQMKMMLRHWYYFRDFDLLIDEFCRSCSICSKNKSRRGKTIGQLSRIVAKKPFEYVAIDTVGDLRSKNSINPIRNWIKIPMWMPWRTRHKQLCVVHNVYIFFGLSDRNFNCNNALILICNKEFMNDQ